MASLVRGAQRFLLLVKGAGTPIRLTPGIQTSLLEEQGAAPTKTASLVERVSLERGCLGGSKEVSQSKKILLTVLTYEHDVNSPRRYYLILHRYV